MEGTNNGVKQLVGEIYCFGSLTFLSLLPSDFQEQLALPKMLFTKLKLPDMVSLRCPLGTVWNVAVTAKDDQYYFFDDGWRQFVDNHSLKANTLLFFEYNIQTSCFRVTMFDHSGACAKLNTPSQAEDKVPSKNLEMKHEAEGSSSNFTGHDVEKNLQIISGNVTTECTMVHGIAFPRQIFISDSKSLSLLGFGIADITGKRIVWSKYAAYGVYMEPEISKYLQQWKDKSGNELSLNKNFWDALISAPVEKYVRIVVFKEITGSEYARELRSAVLYGLAAADKQYDKYELEELEILAGFFECKFLKKNSIISYHFSPNSESAEAVFFCEGLVEIIKVEDAKVVRVILRWYLGLGVTRGLLSPAIIVSLANTLSAELSK